MDLTTTQCEITEAVRDSPTVKTEGERIDIQENKLPVLFRDDSVTEPSLRVDVRSEKPEENIAWGVAHWYLDDDGHYIGADLEFVNYRRKPIPVKELSGSIEVIRIDSGRE